MDLTVTLRNDDGMERSFTVPSTGELDVFESARWIKQLVELFKTPAGFWTQNAEGRSNSSDLYLRLVKAVEDVLIDGGASVCLDRRWVRDKAVVIVCHLAYSHGMVPLPIPSYDQANDLHPAGPD